MTSGHRPHIKSSTYYSNRREQSLERISSPVNNEPLPNQLICDLHFQPENDLAKDKQSDRYQ